MENKQQREDCNGLYADTYYSHTLCLFLGRSIRLPEPCKYSNIYDMFLFFLLCSHFRLSTVFKPSYMKLWKEFILSFLLTMSSRCSSLKLSEYFRLSLQRKKSTNWKDTLKLWEMYNEKPNIGLDTRKITLWRLTEGLLSAYFPKYWCSE